MYKKIISLIFMSFVCFLNLTLAKEISLEEIGDYIASNSLNSKRRELDVEEKRTLAKTPWNYLVPEVLLFGGVKSHENKIELKEKHFFGVRSTYTLFDGGEKQADFQLSQLNLNTSLNEKNILLKKDEIAFLNVLVKEKSILEKLGFLNSQSKSFEDLNNLANGKVRAGILSSVEAFSVNVKIKKMENAKLKLLEELAFLKLEKAKLLNTANHINEELILKESLTEVVNKLKNKLITTNLEESMLENNYLELEKVNIKNNLDARYFKPIISLFAEKGFSRTIEGEFLESDEANRLSFGIEFEMPLIHESGQNFKEVYAAKTRQKILELEKQSLENNRTINKQLNFEKIQIKEKALNRQIEFNKLKQSELAMFKKSINSGLVEYPDYVEVFVDWVELALEEIEKREELIQSILSYSTLKIEEDLVNGAPIASH